MERLNYEIKTAELKHLDAIAHLGTTNNDSLGLVLKVEINDHLSKGHILIAEGDHRLYGFLEYGTSLTGWSLYKLAVAKPARNKGIGSALTKEFIRKATEMGCLTKLKVTKDNLTAITFYQKLGYKMTKVEQSKVKQIITMERQI